jgi:hypothetical protein
MIDEISLSKSFRNLEKNYKTLSLTITDGMIDKIIHSKNSRELEKKL